VRVLACVRLTWKRERSLAVTVGPVLPAGQPVDGVHAVEGVEPVVKPRAPLGQRPGKLQPRRPFVHMEAAIG